jgi:hypothetical protein
MSARRPTAAWSITLIAVSRPDSNGRRNADFVDFAKCLRGRFPVQRLSRPGVEGCRYRSDLLGAVRTQIGAFREVLTKQSVDAATGFADRRRRPGRPASSLRSAVWVILSTTRSPKR